MTIKEREKKMFTFNKEKHFCLNSLRQTKMSIKIDYYSLTVKYYHCLETNIIFNCNLTIQCMQLSINNSQRSIEEIWL